MTMAHADLFVPNEPIPFSGILGPDVEGFSVPTFRAGGRDYVQQVWTGGLVDGFMLLDSGAQEALRPVEMLRSRVPKGLDNLQLAKGDQARYAFQFRDSHVAVLTQSDLGSLLQEYVSQESSSMAPLALVSVLEFLSISRQIDPQERIAAIARARDWLLAQGVTQAGAWERSQLIRCGFVSGFEKELNSGKVFLINEQIPQAMIYRGVSFGNGNLFTHPHFLTWDHLPALAIGYGTVPVVSLQNPKSGKLYVEGNHIVEPIIGMEADPGQRALRIVCGLFDILRLAVEGNAVRMKFIDLRPIGVPVFGNEHEIHLGRSVFPGPSQGLIGNSFGFPLQIIG